MTKKSKSGPTPTERFRAIVDEAITAANVAGDDWMEAAQARGPAFAVVEPRNPFDRSQGGKVVGALLDVCGIVYIRFTDRRTAFAKWLKQQDPNHRLYSLRIHHKYEMRQEMGLGEACYGAALKVMHAHGIKGLELYSRID